MLHTRLHDDPPSTTHRHLPGMELSGPLRIAEVPIPVSGSLGITHCPGRNRIDSAGYQWKRNLRDDLRDLMAWGAGAVLTLVEKYEFAQLGVPEFAAEMRRSRLVWYHMAIPDMSTPGKVFDEAWSRDGAHIFGSLHTGGRLLVHCAGGLGRSGMVAAKLLTALGVPANHAIDAVRRARPGAIETGGQLDYVLNGPSLAADPATAVGHRATGSSVPVGGPVCRTREAT